MDINVLKKMRIFQGIAPEEIRRLVTQFGGKTHRFKKGEVVIRESDQAKWFLLVMKGIIYIYDGGEKKKDRVLVRPFEPGALLGLSLVMGTSNKYPCMLTAETDAEVLFLDVEKIRSIWYKPGYQKLFENIFDCFEDYVRFSRRKFQILRCKKAEDRFLRYLRWRAEDTGAKNIPMPFPRMEDGAEFLGLTRTALSLAITRLVRRGEISHPARAHFTLLK